MVKNCLLTGLLAIFIFVSASHATEMEAILEDSSSTTGFSVKDGSGKTLMRVLGDGNVGIGLTKPTEKLEVNGSVKADKFIGGEISGGIPAGGIIMWSGSIANIPSGWLLCDGANGAPDLRDRFIVGAGQDNGGVASTNITGALSQAGSPTHNHGGNTGSHALTTAEMPAHTHTWSAFQRAGRPGSASIVEAPNPGATTLTTNSAGGGSGHGHTISSDTPIPSYFALAFIMKL